METIPFRGTDGKTRELSILSQDDVVGIVDDRLKFQAKLAEEAAKTTEIVAAKDKRIAELESPARALAILAEWESSLDEATWVELGARHGFKIIEANAVLAEPPAQSPPQVKQETQAQPASLAESEGPWFEESKIPPGIKARYLSVLKCWVKVA